ncbi:MmcQ/YjbR family DNA-binding protein [Sulfurimonas aquatica]|uniref:MmcQ/YjbR family DNA-binding protein n=1 Tax=Sulfurimonas aquatica TaxID=2672570 RepID=A0A975GCL2_9BACT|nr:MmcQ/YjbR family DNA-binding protein [Sulfurimonas aquatica]QSZ41826.1 MmcQ/YjbR family DNA-binding protein [Sulfurimonas aquatica]
MTSDSLEKMLLSKSGAIKEFPFDEVTAVYKVMNKMFALVGTKESYLNINLKCLPDDALGYRDIYECVIPGYHMNKKHWNTVIINGEMKDEVLIEMINDSYDLVVNNLTKKEKQALLNLV